MAFVAPEWRGRGVADALLARLVEEAGARSMTRLHTEASHLARRFFLRHGWVVDREQQVERHGALLTNFLMHYEV